MIARFTAERGWPIHLADLAETIFDGLPKPEALQFEADLLASMNGKANLSQVVTDVQSRMHERALIRLAGNSEPYAELCRSAIREVIIFLRKPSTAESTDSAMAWSAESAESAGWAAAGDDESAALAAANAAAWSVSWAACAGAKAAGAAALSAKKSIADRAVLWSAEAEAGAVAEYQAQRNDLLSVCKSVSLEGLS